MDPIKLLNILEGSSWKLLDDPVSQADSVREPFLKLATAEKFTSYRDAD